MNYFEDNINNKNKASKYIEKHGIIGSLQLIEAYKQIPNEFKATNQPLLDVANYIKFKEIEGKNIILVPKE